MKYWEDFQTKWGFGDGDSVPPDALMLRQVYVRELNNLLRKRQSAVRLLSYDRPGIHNSLMIVRVDAQLVCKVPERRLWLGQEIGGWEPPGDWSEPETDAAYDAVLDEAEDMELDSMVETTVRIKRRRAA
ncbi:MAG: hypothetical protein WCS52_04875 [bacterium]